MCVVDALEVDIQAAGPDKVAEAKGEAIAWFEATAVAPPTQQAVYMPGFGKTPGSVIMVPTGGAHAGDPVAMRYLGVAYMTGTGVKKGEEWGRTLLACAARFGVPGG